MSPSSWGSARIRSLNGAVSVSVGGEAETCWFRVVRRAFSLLLEEGVEEGTANAQPWKIG